MVMVEVGNSAFDGKGGYIPGLCSIIFRALYEISIQGELVVWWSLGFRQMSYFLSIHITMR